jgi:type I restriction-modification system DNA methylase subunit
MNLAIRGIDANREPRDADSLRTKLDSDLNADFILANPSFSMSDWGGSKSAAGRALEIRHAVSEPHQPSLDTKLL